MLKRPHPSKIFVFNLIVQPVTRSKLASQLLTKLAKDKQFMSVANGHLSRPADKTGASYFKDRQNEFWALRCLLIVTSALILVWLFWSCKDARPQAIRELINNTRAVLDEARRHDADRYAPNAMRIAEGTFRQAMAEVESQESRAFPFISYDRAKQQLGRAKQAAYGAIFEAAAEREKARRDSLLLIGQARKILRPLFESKLTSPRSVAPTKVDLENLANTLADANWAYQSGDYLTARAKVEWLLLQIKELES